MKNFFKSILLSLSLSTLFFVAPHSASADEKNPAPDFTLSTLDGKAITLSQLRGKKVLIDFWASWCPPCRRELVDVNQMLQDYPREKFNYEVLAVSVDNTSEEAKAYISKMGYSSMTVLHDDQNIAGNRYGVQGIPSLFLVDEKGIVQWNSTGSVEKEVLLDVLGLSKKAN